MGFLRVSTDKFYEDVSLCTLTSENKFALVKVQLGSADDRRVFECELDWARWIRQEGVLIVWCAIIIISQSSNGFLRGAKVASGHHPHAGIRWMIAKRNGRGEYLDVGAIDPDSACKANMRTCTYALVHDLPMRIPVTCTCNIHDQTWKFG